MTDVTGTRTDGTRQQILRSASREFAQRPYTKVSLEDIIAGAGLTKGGLYFYFRSKHALAAAIIDEQSQIVRDGLSQRLERRLSGLETLIETGYFIATQDIRSDDIRARCTCSSRSAAAEACRRRFSGSGLQRSPRCWRGASPTATSSRAPIPRLSADW